MTAPHSNTPSETQNTASDQWADIGVNLTDRQFNDDRETVIERAASAGVAWQLITGTSIDESRAAIALAALLHSQGESQGRLEIRQGEETGYPSRIGVHWEETDVAIGGRVVHDEVRRLGLG